MRFSNVKRLTVTALSVALCVVLPMAFHVIPNAGTVMLPMYIPVLLCGTWLFSVAPNTRATPSMDS